MASARAAPSRRDLARLSLAALGVVYGDIGTSPLYALKECFAPDRGLLPDRANVLGVLSLVVWALVLIVVVKYLLFVVRADNHGEGGIMALLALLVPPERRPDPRRARRTTLIVGLALLGTGLIAADGVITPAISVLGAMEGLVAVSTAFEPAIVPLAIVVLLALFAVQRYGSGSLGRIFGAFMLVWFATLFALGLPAILRAPVVLQAVDPRFALAFLADHGSGALVVLGSLVLCVTGAEALYADIGHFGARPIRLAWFAAAFPALLASYLGQGALLLTESADAVANPFFALAPRALLYPLVGIATCAAVIASQALISAVFSLAMQAIHLGYLPRMTVQHTSSSVHGQIYVPLVNAVLAVACIAAVLVFRSTSGLAAAYGLSVICAMIVTTLLLFGVVRSVWRWGWLPAVSLVGLFLAVELPFLLATSGKLLHGGWFPVAIGALLFVIMTTWRRGRALVAAWIGGSQLAPEALVADIRRNDPVRVRGTAVFLGRNPRGVPRSLLHHLKHSRVLHERVVLLTLTAREVPRVAEEDAVALRTLGEGLYQVEAFHGFLEAPDVPRFLALCAALRPELLAGETSFYLGRDRLLATDRPGMATWRKQLFVLLDRNARPADAFFRIPPQRVIELGAQVEI